MKKKEPSDGRDLSWPSHIITHWLLRRVFVVAVLLSSYTIYLIIIIRPFWRPLRRSQRARHHLFGTQRKVKLSIYAPRYLLNWLGPFLLSSIIYYPLGCERGGEEGDESGVGNEVIEGAGNMGLGSGMALQDNRIDGHLLKLLLSTTMYHTY